MPTLTSTITPPSPTNRQRSQSVSTLLSKSVRTSTKDPIPIRIPPPNTSNLDKVDLVPTSGKDLHRGGGDEAVTKWDVSVWNEQVQHHHPRPKRPRLSRGSPLLKPLVITEDTTSRHHLPPQEVTEAHSFHRLSAPLSPSGDHPHISFPSFQSQRSPPSPVLPQDAPLLSPHFLSSPLVSPSGLSPAAGGRGPRAPPPSAGSSESGHSARIEIEDDIAMTDDECGYEYDVVSKAKQNASSSTFRTRSRRAQSMSAVHDLSAVDISEAFSKLDFFASSSSSKPGIGHDGLIPRVAPGESGTTESGLGSASGYRGRPLRRKRPLEPDYNDPNEPLSSGPPTVEAHSLLSRRMSEKTGTRRTIPLRIRSSSTRPSLTSEPPSLAASVYDTQSPSNPSAPQTPFDEAWTMSQPPNQRTTRAFSLYSPLHHHHHSLFLSSNTVVSHGFGPLDEVSSYSPPSPTLHAQVVHTSFAIAPLKPFGPSKGLPLSRDESITPIHMDMDDVIIEESILR